MGNVATHSDPPHFIFYTFLEEPPRNNFPGLFVLADPRFQPNKLAEIVYLCVLSKARGKNIFGPTPNKAIFFLKAWHLLLTTRDHIHTLS